MRKKHKNKTDAIASHQTKTALAKTYGVTRQDVKLIRESLNMTQAELAERLGIDRSSLAHMENGRPVPRYIGLLLASLVVSRGESWGWL